MAAAEQVPAACGAALPAGPPGEWLRALPGSAPVISQGRAAAATPARSA